jgi:ribosomal protein S16
MGAGKSHLQKSGYSLEYAAFRAPMPAVHLDLQHRLQEIRLSVNQERVAYWLSVGAQPSERVAQLLKESAKAAA